MIDLFLKYAIAAGIICLTWMSCSAFGWWIEHANPSLTGTIAFVLLTGWLLLELSEVD